MENNKEIETNTFTLRLPKNLDEAIQRDAQNEKRSKTAHITFLLEKHINQVLAKRKPETARIGSK
jgi:hypothetical protein